MDTKMLVMFAVPVFFGPILIDLLVGKLQKRSRYRANDLTTNLSLSMLSTLVGLAATVATVGIYVYLHKEFALFGLATDHMATWLLAFIVYDLLYYCAHRAHHRVALLWAAHVVHHSGEDMNFGLALRQSVFSELTVWIFLLPLAVLGIAPEVYLAVAAFQLVYQYSLHNTYIGNLGWLEKIFITPSQHRVHHGRNHQYIDKNYGNVLVIWDRLFGTYQRELPEYPVAYGLRDGVKSWNPLTVNFQYLGKLATKVRRSHGIGDKFRALVREPEWLPAYLPSEQFKSGDEDVPSRVFRKYNPVISRITARYSLFQFLAIFAAFVALLWTVDELQPLHISILAGFIAITAVVTGGIFEGRNWAWPVDFARIVLLALLLMVTTWGEFPGALPPIMIATYCGISMAYLFGFRRFFHESAQVALPDSA